ncbi:ATP-grasp domain-containing protein [Halopseudomonas bauzanensis]|uniref:ATP-grasp domain-containing protein n=1 Tax=Halopseudomonas bauzanensis TaxID=653930 RepID=A0A4U0YIG3_9GAMM|nr:ATP-grasp domain-containing protein [Halopseudomonas bauzanensis]TKA90995.1 ATP-grasp domain-containing protein [Halopseudomonas bauzanensis]
MNVLLTCAGRRHYLASYFQEVLSGFGKVIGTDMDLSAPALQACDVAVKVPGVFAENYLDTLKEVVVRENINMVFSLNDLEVGLLSENRTQFEKETGATVYVPPVDTLEICADKWLTYRFAREIGIETPATYLTVEDATAALAAGEVSYPLIVKPRWGSASIGLFVVGSPEELASGFTQCHRAVTSSALAALGSESPVIIQEVIQGPEYGVDLLYGKNDNFIGFAAKKKLAMRAGETDKAVTVAPELFEELAAKIASVLPHRGNLDCDFLEREGRFYLLEFNPRFGGGYPFTHLAGANHAQMLIDDYQGKPLSPYGYRVGQGFAKCDTLVEVPVD